MATIKEKMAKNTANLRAAKDISVDEIKPNLTPQTGPGMMGALAAAKSKIEELESRGTGSMLLSVSSIVVNPWQPRRQFNKDDIKSLADSIEDIGLMQPIVVRIDPHNPSQYQVVVGERRLRAHQLLGREDIKALVVDLDNAEMGVWALSENIYRVDLSDYEISLAVMKVQEEFPSKKALAASLGKSRAHLYRYFDFQKLPGFMLTDLEAQPNLITAGTAAAIATLLSKYGSKANEQMEEAWQRVKEGSLDQSKFCDTVKMALVRGIVASAPHGKQVSYLYHNGQRAANIIKDDKSVVIKIKASMLDPVNEEKLMAILNSIYEQGT